MYTIKLADYRDDYLAVRQFWYQVYCVERKVLNAKADHKRRLLDDALIRKGNLFIAQDNFGICGTVLTTYTDRAQLGEYVDFYEMNKLANLHRQRLLQPNR